MMVEDHPYDYRDFEGVIPEGNYGGGTVIVWDEGIYEPMNGDKLNQKEREALLIKKLHAGDLKLRLHGKKIKGDYALFRLKKDEKAWLLVKKDDEYASEEEVIKKNKSVKSGKTLAQIAKLNGTEIKHPEEEVPKNKTRLSGVKAQTKKRSAKNAVKAVSKTSTRKKKALI
jgi:bifunctional non-homologous end joining protein LigD